MKSLNDKWIAGGDFKTKTFFEDFLFLDKASRNIGDVLYLDIFELKRILNKDSFNKDMSVYTFIASLLIYNKFVAFLLQNGIKAIPTENENFDTDLHEAITTFPAPSEDMKGKIVDCVSKGYTLNEKVIRFSKVVVGE
jgi:molecular chaperone GrpE (heat shock protein)